MEISLADLTGTDPLARMFGRHAPVELEVGCGKGRFLIRCARQLPGTGFIGIERANRFFQVALARAERRGLRNVRLIRTDAWFLVRYVLPTASLRAIHVLFPDPWPKKRHHKRRIFQPGFVEAAERVLEHGGRLNVATDHADYFDWIEEVVSRSAGLRRNSEFALDERLPPGEVGHTNYEIKYRRGGRVIRQATWSRDARHPGTHAIPGHETAREAGSRSPRAS